MRWLGAAFIIAASYVCGTALARAEGQKAIAVDALIAFLKYIRRRISSERTALYDIFSAFSNAFLEEAGFLKTLRESNYTLNQRWAGATKQLCLDFEIEAELLRLGEDLGRLPLDEQEKRIDACLDALCAEKERLCKALPAKQKSKKTVCLLAGLLAAIILL